MGRIRVLPEHVRNQIAAGEVVERPASVVKEILENAIDAGAVHVRIDVEDGGKRLIRCIDDGSGMSEDDAALACLPHSTSKISTVDDLPGIRTLGFRGEALSSIGAVSALRILTRSEGAPEGTEIIVLGGRVQAPRPAASPRGTLVEVRDLFYNVPARSRFLRRSSTEFRAISDVIQGIALARPGVGIEVGRDGKRVLTLPPARDDASRVDALLGASLRKGLRPVEGRDAGMSLRGFVSSPEESRSSTRSQVLIVDGRPVKDRGVRHALTEAYHTYLMKGRFPIAFLYLDLEPGAVDFNVHPTKAEVRFRDPRAIHALVVGAVRRAIEEDRPRARLRVPRRESARVADASPLWGPPAMARDGPPPAPPPAREPPASPGGVLAPRRPFIQVHDAYVVQETEEGIRVVDQHALHERILLHRLRERLAGGEVESQGALVPIPLAASPGEMEVARDRDGDLRRLGYAVEPFGQGQIAIRSYPALLDGADQEAILREVLALLETRAAREIGEGILDEVLRRMACRGAIKAGTRLREDEIAAMLEEEGGVQGSFACAHGRPTNLTLTLSDLERQFGRR